MCVMARTVLFVDYMLVPVFLLQSGIAFQTLSFADRLSVLLSNVLVSKYVANFIILATEKKI